MGRVIRNQRKGRGSIFTAVSTPSLPLFSSIPALEIAKRQIYIYTKLNLQTLIFWFFPTEHPIKQESRTIPYP